MFAQWERARADFEASKGGDSLLRLCGVSPVIAALLSPPPHVAENRYPRTTAQ
ncbi:hypothetical protein [Amycolatopsis sp.]|uniref:hypothetical protein n=1 Tax=Amycolatopsis sp. TaxID=37632 RepID=UPI0039C85EC9